MNQLRQRFLLYFIFLLVLGCGSGTGVSENTSPNAALFDPTTGTVPLPNVLATPHIAYNSKEAGENMLRIAYATLNAFLRGEKLHVVNAG